MIQSMTGYGKSIIQLNNKKITIEVKSLNSKNLDLNTRISSLYRPKELEIRKKLASHLNRGKVDFFIYVEQTGEDTSSKINKEVVKSYMNQLKDITEGESLELLKMAVRMPDAMVTTREEIDENEWEKISQEINVAITNIKNYRVEEGKVLEKDFVDRINTIKLLLEKVITIDPERMESLRERLQKAVSELKTQVDENRFEQELIFYIEKYDITEEKVRLKNHLDYFISTLNSDESNGKKLGFISQEIGREINTIGSKANFAPIQKIVVQMKDELEKIKEQLLNVL